MTPRHTKLVVRCHRDVAHLIIDFSIAYGAAKSGRSPCLLQNRLSDCLIDPGRQNSLRDTLDQAYLSNWMSSTVFLANYQDAQLLLVRRNPIANQAKNYAVLRY